MSVEDSKMSLGEHLEVLRKMLFHVVAVVFIATILVFCFKDLTFKILLAPKDNHFILFTTIEKILHLLGSDFSFESYNIQLISTELSSQFMTHLTTACLIGVLCASPYIIYELFKFITPALYDNEKKYSVGIAISAYILFLVGILMNYFILFPIAFRFLATYQVDPNVVSTITIASYISTFTSLCFTMGIVFEMPILAFILAKLGLIKSEILIKYRKHSVIIIMVVAAFITPPDIFTLILVTIPLYLLYEVCIIITKKFNKN